MPRTLLLAPVEYTLISACEVTNVFRLLKYSRTATDRSDPALTRASLDLGSLEDRVLFSAAPLPAEFFQQLADSPDPAELPDGDRLIDSPSPWRLLESWDDVARGASPSGEDADRVQLILIDERLEDLQSLLDEWSIADNTETYIYSLSAQHDGILQIEEILRQFDEVDAVHLLSHGQDGELVIGATRLSAANLEDYTNQWVGWQSSLVDDAQMFLYACNVASSEHGQSFVRDLAAWTDTVVSASTDLTGAAWHGGDWDLEFVSSQPSAMSFDGPRLVHADPVFADAVLSWDGLLAVSTVTLPADGGAGSLRQAVLDANANVGADTIQLSEGRYVLSLAGSNEDASVTGDLDVTDDLVVIGQGADVTVIDAGQLDRIFEIHAGTLTLRQLTLTGGFADDGGAIANRGQLVLEDVVIEDNVATAKGGAVYSDGTMSVARSTFAANQANDGGAIYVSATGGSSLILDSSTLAYNQAANRGGALWVEGHADLQHVTIAFNQAATGGGLAVTGTASVAKSLIAQNSAAAASDLEGAIQSLGANFFGSTDGATATDVSDQVGGNAGLDSTLRYNGGLTPTLAIAANSAARDLGPLLGGFDQRGVLRDAAPDAGAFEAMVGPVIVTSTSDGIDGDVSSLTALRNNPGGDGLISLREAIVAANATVDPVTIILPSGVYVLSQLGPQENSGLTGDLDITGNLTLLGQGAGTTFVDGLGIDRVFEIHAGTVAMSGITIRNGYTQQDGGGLRAHAASQVTLTNAMLLENRGQRGGGIASEANLTLRNVTVAGNQSETFGGGIASFGSGATLDLANVTVSGNAALRGGGLSLASDATLQHATVAFNTAEIGGGIYSDFPGITVTLSQSILASNTGGNSHVGLASNGGNVDSDGTADLSSASDLEADPQLHTTLTDQGNGLLVHTLLNGSPAIDAASGSPLTIDQSGQSRGWDGDLSGTAAADAGAWEFVPGSPPAPDFVWKAWQVFEPNGPSLLLSPEAQLSYAQPVDWNGGTVLVELQGGPIAGEDQLSLQPQGNGQDEVAISGNNVFYSGVIVGTMTSSTVGTTSQLQITFNPQATNEAVQAILRRLSYDNTATLATSGMRNLLVRVATADGTTVERTSQLVVASGGLAFDDAYSVTEDMPLQLTAPGLLLNDRFGPLLLYDAGLDTDGDGNWEDANASGSDWVFDGVGVTRVGSPNASQPGITAAYVFDGTGGGEMPSLSDLPGDVDEGSASFEFWVNPTDAVGTEVLFETGSSLHGISFVLDDEFLRFTVVDPFLIIFGITHQLSVDLSTELNDDAFIHVAGVIDDRGSTTNLRLFVNGVLVDSSTDLTGLSDWAGSNASGLGRGEGSVAGGFAGNFQGQMGQLRVYDYALTTDDILRNADAVTAVGAVPGVVGLLTDQAQSQLFAESDGSLMVNAAMAYQHLRNGETASETFRYVVEYADRRDVGTVQLTIQGANDAPTGVLLSNYHVPEDDKGATIGTLQAVDPDTGDTHTFSTSDSRFRITGSNTLRLRGNVELDYDDGPTVDVDVTVTDSSGASFVQTLTLFVVPENELPEMTSPDNFTLIENTNPGLVITATDPDGDPVVIDISSGADASRFVWNNASQRLFFVATPNFEQPTDANGDNIYEVTLRLMDDQGGQVFETVRVEILPVNEHAPVFTSPTNFTVFEGIPFVTRVQATDADLPAASLRYSIVGGADAGDFSIQSTTGNLWFHQAPDFFAPADADGDNVYHLQIRVSDQQGMQQTQSITVQVLMVDDPPETEADRYQVEAGSQLVITGPGVLANDQDPEGAPLSASLVTAPEFGTLTLQSNGGFVYVTDNNFIGEVEFVYAASDPQGLRTNQTVTILVLAPLAAQDISFVAESSSSTSAGSSGNTSGNTTGNPSADAQTAQGSSSAASSEPAANNSADAAGPDSAPATTPVAGSDPHLTRSELTDNFTRDNPIGLQLGLMPTTSAGPLRIEDLLSQKEDMEAAGVISSADGSFNEVVRTYRTLDATHTGINFFRVQETWVPPANSGFWREMTTVQEQIIPDMRISDVQVTAATGVMGSLSLGYVVWMLRAGSLITTFMAQLPAWTMIDPLPVLQFASGKSRGEAEDDSLEDMIRQSNSRSDGDPTSNDAALPGVGRDPARSPDVADRSPQTAGRIENTISNQGI